MEMSLFFEYNIIVFNPCSFPISFLILNRFKCSVVIQFRFICVYVCLFICDVSLINDDLVCVRVFVQMILFNLEPTQKKYNRRTQLESHILHA